MVIMIQNAEKRRHTVFLIFLFFGIVTAFFYLMIGVAMPKYKAASTKDQITDTDLSRDCICLDSSHAEVYAGRLYGSGDFAAGAPSAGDSGAKFRTSRIVLPLKAGKTYGIMGQTATYAQRVYVNGELLSEVGTVSDSPDGFVPRTDLYTVYFTPSGDTTEIIIQNAWFNHRSGAFHKIFLAEQGVISHMERAQTLCDGLIAGTLLAMAIFFFGMVLFRTSNLAMLYFSLSCLCAALNYLIYESKQIMVFFPSLNWYTGHKIELLTNIYYFLFLALFALATLRVSPGKRLAVLLLLPPGALTLYYIAAPSVVYTRYTVPVGACMLLYELFAVSALWILAAGGKKLGQPDNLIVCLSPLLVLIVSVIEGATYFSHILYLRAYAMILLAFCNALVLTIHLSRTEKRLNEAKQRELEIAEENAMLEKMNSLKNEFMRNIAHEMKTPLTVMSGYAQLTGRQIRRNAVNEETSGNLDTIAREAERLSDMVTRLLDVTYHSADEKAAGCFRARELLDDAAAVCRPVLAKNENQLRINCGSVRDIAAGREMLLQVLINLAINSNKHTEGGTVVLQAEDDAENDGRVRFSVSDSGTGISKEALPHVFERGYSTDGGSGLGLTICRDIVESMGGMIAVEKTDRSGTTVCFLVPAERGVQEA